MKTFEELGVSQEIRKAIEEMGYENPVLPNYSELGYGIGSDLFHIALFLGFEEFKYQSVGLKFALELFR